MNIIYPLVSVLIVSLISIIVALPFLIKKKLSHGTLLFLLSISVGVLLSTVFLDFLPEIFMHVEEHDHGHNIIGAPLIILLGFLLMFVIEKFVHYHHDKKCENGNCGHGHAYNLAPINLIGDGIHNFLDGLVIAGAYAVNITLGITATISIIFHEVPQEIADMGVLLYSGMSRKRALYFNFLSAITAIVGALVGILLIGRLDGFTEFIIPFAAGNFIYIAATNLLPQLHRHCKLKDSLIHLFAILLGIAIIIVVTVYSPHIH
ncbi:ZIP family metal transporter [Candidatus Woesearchaeota archaeon]|jgi:zinc and cadmium transporter|nr:ZIP family metal transporter [Candidatus Woesearchaeota archaeon]MBT5271835.1 ZIP family metal transporter [Candidatus Woesearchaeota archaeon]MBT6040729.1 ZIP family metal transporter [Candidatus Woesearchaeota archaeon]MBT6337450.1 ZIP family metal transporter [Candidatus Woesearchaeota archaeon]MBT7927976.1 ZIP family metal transporter [Candidatus Woesearchaeota archaeon]